MSLSLSMASTRMLPKDAVVEDSEDDGEIFHDDEYSAETTQEAFDVEDDVSPIPAQAFNSFIQLVRQAPDIADAIDTEKAVVQDKSHHKLQDVPGHEAFYLTAQGNCDVP
jgi:hypothetical protein